jgi:hypothetical protein
MANNRIRVSELEFDQIKQNLKSFLQGQATFSDYDFEGSNLSVILDILAYNTHYNAMYTNFALNEVFLDSASKRDSVVSLARSIGYRPRSATCATTTINFTVTGTNTTPPFLTLPGKLPFFGIKDGVRYNFYTDDDVTAAYNATTQSYAFNQILLREGTPLRNTFQYSAQNKYTIPNNNVDTSTLKVYVQQSSSNNTTTIYTPADDISLVEFDTTVYFLKEIEGGFHQLEFGDNILGKALVPGNIITVEYIVSSGQIPNRIRVLSYGGSAILGSMAITTTVLAPVSNGRDPETTDEIRFNAPNFYAAQNRAVTVDDYKVLLKSKMATIGDLIVWGGENNDPPVYGKVFISAVTPDGRTLSTEQKNDVTNSISTFKIATVQIEYVDAEYIDVNLEANVYYDQTLTNKTPAVLASDIASAYALYNENTLAKFDSIIRNSVLIRTAEEADRSIVNVIPKLTLSYALSAVFNQKTNYIVKLRNPILSRIGSLKSSGFYCSEATTVCYIDDTETDSLVLFTIESGVRRNIRVVGSVNHEMGSFTLNALTINSVIGNGVVFTLVPTSPDVVSFNNKIVRLNLNNLSINVIADGNLNGQLKTAYNFTQV